MIKPKTDVKKAAATVFLAPIVLELKFSLIWRFDSLYAKQLNG